MTLIIETLAAPSTYPLGVWLGLSLLCCAVSIRQTYLMLNMRKTIDAQDQDLDEVLDLLGKAYRELGWK